MTTYPLGRTRHAHCLPLRAGLPAGRSGCVAAFGLLEASQRLSTSLGVAALGTFFFARHLAADALQITAWAEG
jgi:hypothetical protein